MSDSYSESESAEQAEVKRLRQEYQRRQEIIPNNFYSRPGDVFMYWDRHYFIKGALKRENVLPLLEKEIIEIGCGIGSWLQDFLSWGAEEQRLHGIDLDEAKVREAQKRLPKAEIMLGDATHAPWPSRAFDIILQSTVFTSILEESFRIGLAREMMRLLKPDGVILWYDFRFNNPYNKNVRGIGAKEIVSLFPDFEIGFYKITLAAPLSRFLAPKLIILCKILNRVSFLRTHYFAFMRRKKLEIE